MRHYVFGCQITAFAWPKISTVHDHTDASGPASLQMNSAPQTAESFSHFPALEMYQGSPAKAIRLRAFAKRKKKINENQAAYENI